MPSGFDQSFLHVLIDIVVADVGRYGDQVKQIVNEIRVMVRYY
jgi:hypothetical protein